MTKFPTIQQYRQGVGSTPWYRVLSNSTHAIPVDRFHITWASSRTVIFAYPVA